MDALSSLFWRAWCNWVLCQCSWVNMLPKCFHMGNVFSVHGVCITFVSIFHGCRQEMFPPRSPSRSIFGSGSSQLRVKVFKESCLMYSWCYALHNLPLFLKTERPGCFPQVTSNSIRHDHQTGKADTRIFPSLTGIFFFFYLTTIWGLT